MMGAGGWPDIPCDACPRVAAGLPPPCLAQATRAERLCVHAAAGHEKYIALLKGESPVRPAPAFPSLAQQAANLAGAFGRFMASGGELATEEEKARRMGICGGCEHYLNQRCQLCGCHLTYKVAMLSEHCPVEKW